MSPAVHGVHARRAFFSCIVRVTGLRQLPTLVYRPGKKIKHWEPAPVQAEQALDASGALELAPVPARSGCARVQPVDDALQSPLGTGYATAKGEEGAMGVARHDPVRLGRCVYEYGVGGVHQVGACERAVEVCWMDEGELLGDPGRVVCEHEHDPRLWHHDVATPSGLRPTGDFEESIAMQRPVLLFVSANRCECELGEKPLNARVLLYPTNRPQAHQAKGVRRP